MRILITAIAVAVTCSPLPSNARPHFSFPNIGKPIAPSAPSSSITEYLLNDLRGGASKSKKKKSTSKKVKTVTGSNKIGGRKNTEKLSTSNKAMDSFQKFKDILPLTRAYIFCVGFFTLVGAVLGEENAHAVLALDPVRTVYGLEVWRIVSAASYLGKASVGWLMSAYYLYEYGSNLERVDGTAQHLVFLITQVSMLTVLSLALGVPFFGASVITSMLHVISRSLPRQNVKWLIFTVPYWSLPYGLMLSDVLQQGAMAAMPHVLGILTGHFYFYHKYILPKLPGGEDWLAAPNWLKRRMEPSGFLDDDDARKKMESVLKKRKKGKGRKLSG